jgi:predicted dehydrogenase
MKTLKKAIKVGAVGCGYWGPNLIRNFRQLPDCELKVICDASEQRLQHMRRLHPGLATTDRFEELLHNAEIEAVVTEEITAGAEEGQDAEGLEPGEPWCCD